MRELPDMGKEAAEILSSLLVQENMKGSTEDTIEHICSLVAEKLRAQGLSDSTDDYLEPHAFSVMEHIEDEYIRSMHVMEGVG